MSNVGTLHILWLELQLGGSYFKNDSHTGGKYNLHNSRNMCTKIRATKYLVAAKTPFAGHCVGHRCRTGRGTKYISG